MCAHVRTLSGILTLRVDHDKEVVTKVGGAGGAPGKFGLPKVSGQFRSTETSVFDTPSLRGYAHHVPAMKRINAKGEVFQQTSIYIRENIYLLAREEGIPMSESAEQGVIAALRARGVEV